MGNINVAFNVLSDGIVFGTASHMTDEVASFETIRNFVLDGFTVDPITEDANVLLEMVNEEIDDMVAEAERLMEDVPGAIARGDLIPIEQFIADLA